MSDPLRTLLSDAIGVPEPRLGEDPAMDDLPEWDSVAHLHFVMAVEEHCGVKFDAGTMLAWRRLSEVRAALASAER